MKKHSTRNILLLIFSMIWITGFSQTLIKGKVVDEANLPLPGASIVLKDSNKGVVTNFDGDFFIETNNSKETLVVSYMGFKTQEVNFTGKNNLTIVMVADAQSLNFDDDQVGAVVAFLRTLNDDNFDRTIPENVPSGLSVGGNIND